MIKASSLQGKAVEEGKLIAECCLKFGAGKRYVLEYLENLELAGKIVRAAGMLLTPEQYERERDNQTSQDIINNLDAKPEQ